LPTISTHHVIAIGELLWDVIALGPRLGGTTTNFAVLTVRLGGRSALVSCIGDDPLGRQAMQLLEPLSLPGADGHVLQLDGVQVSSSLPTGTVMVELDADGRPRYEIVSPSAWDAIALTDGALKMMPTASAVCFGTLAQRAPVSRSTIRALIEAAPASCVRICDLNLRQPFYDEEVVRWCIEHADVLKVSDEELPEVGRLLGYTWVAPSSEEAHQDADGLESSCGSALTSAATTAAQALLKIAPACQLVAITLGPHGSLLTDRSGTFRHSGFSVDVVDTVGAGDAFTAGLAFAYLAHASLEHMSDVSNLCGSYVASQPGATPELSPKLLDSIQAILAGKP
jgi:fructokinase